jgi:3-dehydroquinate synthase
MQAETISFSTSKVQYLNNTPFSKLKQIASPEHTILLVDSKVLELQRDMFAGYRTISIAGGEEHKTLQQIEAITQQLITHQVHRKSILVGIGGGIVTDIVGFIGSIYMRGIIYGFVPTTLLGMIDAAIGGKNGVNMGLHKNMLGTIKQPQFIAFDTQFLKTLPNEEWSNGYAEVIKYACLFDEPLFHELKQHSVAYYQQNEEGLQQLITRCVNWKNKIVASDEQETGERKLLNFGHTAGHALEKLYNLPHGYAVGLGMLVACRLSEQVTGLDNQVTQQLTSLLTQYHLPVKLQINVAEVMKVLVMDKKRQQNTIDYVLMTHIGNCKIAPLSFSTIQQSLETFADESNS